MNLQGYVKDLKILFQGECIGATRGIEILGGILFVGLLKGCGDIIVFE